MIVLVRHGQTDANRDGRLLGRSDPSLNDLGRAQAAVVAAAIERQPVAVVSSPLRRARETAEILAGRWSLGVEVDERLVELDYGDWDQLASDEVTPEEWARWRADPDFAPPGGESLAAVQRRVATCMDELARRDGDDGGLIVAVSHVSPIKAALVWALGVGPEVTWRVRLDPGSITRLAPTRSSPPGRALVVTWNERLSGVQLPAG